MRRENVTNILVIISLLLLELLKLPFLLLWELGCWLFLTPIKKDVSRDIVFITGGAQGIGREIAFGYGRLGATVVCVDVNSKANEDTVADLKKNGIRAYGYTCDITKKGEVDRLARTVEEEVGEVSIIVNNAGIMAARPFEEHSEQQIRQLFEVNIIAHFWIIQAFLPGMVKRDKGHIVAVSSCAGIFATENFSAYCATKWAIRGLMGSLGKELELKNSNVKLTTVCPYFANTKFYEKPIVGRLWLLSPRSIARVLINAQQTDAEIVSVPKFLYYLINLGNVMPRKSRQAGERAIGSGANSTE